MHNYCCDCDGDLYFRERLEFPAHCVTCNCIKRRSEIEVSHNIRVPKKITIPLRKTSCHCLSGITCCCPFDDLLYYDECLCYECRKVLGQSEASIHRKEQKSISDYRHTLLETWFTRFDSNGDGYLDLVDVESLLKYLGVEIRSFSTKKIIQICDRDSDGLLSFPEFVCLWQQAAHHDGDFIKRIGCPGLSHIVKKYRIFSNIHHCPYQENYCKHITMATTHPVHQIKCKCGLKNKVNMFIKQDDVVHPSRKKVPKSKDAAAESDVGKEFPIMSKNRDDHYY